MWNHESAQDAEDAAYYYTTIYMLLKCYGGKDHVQILLHFSIAQVKIVMKR